MHTQVGLWIDHRQAFIVRLKDDKTETETITSNLEKHVRTAGGSRSRTIYGPQDIVAEDRRDRHFGHHLHQYYEKVAQALHDAPLVYIMGPGEAKMEFKNILESVNPVIRPVTELETCDKLTLNQIVAKVKDHYMISPNRTF